MTERFVAVTGWRRTRASLAPLAAALAAALATVVGLVAAVGVTDARAGSAQDQKKLAQQISNGIAQATQENRKETSDSGSNPFPPPPISMDFSPPLTAFSPDVAVQVASNSKGQSQAGQPQTLAQNIKMLTNVGGQTGSPVDAELPQQHIKYVEFLLPGQGTSQTTSRDTWRVNGQANIPNGCYLTRTEMEAAQSAGTAASPAGYLVDDTVGGNADETCTDNVGKNVKVGELGIFLSTFTGPLGNPFEGLLDNWSGLMAMTVQGMMTPGSGYVPADLEPWIEQALGQWVMNECVKSGQSKLTCEIMAAGIELLLEKQVFPPLNDLITKLATQPNFEIVFNLMSTMLAEIVGNPMQADVWLRAWPTGKEPDGAGETGKMAIDVPMIRKVLFTQPCVALQNGIEGRLFNWLFCQTDSTSAAQANQITSDIKALIGKGKAVEQAAAAKAGVKLPDNVAEQLKKDVLADIDLAEKQVRGTASLGGGEPSKTTTSKPKTTTSTATTSSTATNATTTSTSATTTSATTATQAAGDGGATTTGTTTSAPESSTGDQTETDGSRTSTEATTTAEAAGTSTQTETDAGTETQTQTQTGTTTQQSQTTTEGPGKTGGKSDADDEPMSTSDAFLQAADSCQGIPNSLLQFIECVFTGGMAYVEEVIHDVLDDIRDFILGTVTAILMEVLPENILDDLESDKCASPVTGNPLLPLKPGALEGVSAAGLIQEGCLDLLGFDSVDDLWPFFLEAFVQSNGYRLQSNIGSDTPFDPDSTRPVGFYPDSAKPMTYLIQGLAAKLSIQSMPIGTCATPGSPTGLCLDMLFIDDMGLQFYGPGVVPSTKAFGPVGPDGQFTAPPTADGAFRAPPTAFECTNPQAWNAVFTGWGPTQAGPQNPTNEAGSIGPQGYGCNPDLPFAPVQDFTTASTTQAASSANLSSQSSRQAGDAYVKQVELDFEGVIGSPYATPVLCTPDQAASAQCPAASQIGSAGMSVKVFETRPINISLGIYNTTVDTANGDLATVWISGKAPNIGNNQIVSMILHLQVTRDANGVVNGIHAVLDGVPVAFDIRGITVNFNGTQSYDGHPLLVNPTNCQKQYSVTDIFVSELNQRHSSALPYPVTGCQNLKYQPTLDIDLSENTPGAVPQTTMTINQGAGAGFANTASTTITMPSGFMPNMGPNVKVGVCSLGDLKANDCPANSKVGTATAASPLLLASEPLTGPVYLAAADPQRDPTSVAQIHMDLRGLINQPITGTLRVLPGEQVTIEMGGLPDVPLSQVQVKMQGGATQGLLRNPTTCGSFNFQAQMTAHSGAQANPTDPVTIGGNCAPQFGANVQPAVVNANPTLTASVTPRSDDPFKQIDVGLGSGAEAIKVGTAHVNKSAKKKAQKELKQAKKDLAKAKKLRAKAKKAKGKQKQKLLSQAKKLESKAKKLKAQANSGQSVDVGQLTLTLQGGNAVPYKVRMSGSKVALSAPNRQANAVYGTPKVTLANGHLAATNLPNKKITGYKFVINGKAGGGVLTNPSKAGTVVFKGTFTDVNGKVTTATTSEPITGKKRQPKACQLAQKDRDKAKKLQAQMTKARRKGQHSKAKKLQKQVQKLQKEATANERKCHAQQTKQSHGSKH